MEDILTKVASYLNMKQLFVVSRVSKVWNDATFYSKRNKMLEIKKEIHRAHMCNNSCACALDNICPWIIENYALRRYICAIVNNNFEKVPMWIYKYIHISV